MLAIVNAALRRAVGGDQAVAANHDPFRIAGEVGLDAMNLGARRVDPDPNTASFQSQKTTSLSSQERPSTLRRVIRRSRRLDHSPPLSSQQRPARRALDRSVGTLGRASRPNRYGWRSATVCLVRVSNPAAGEGLTCVPVTR